MQAWKALSDGILGRSSRGLGLLSELRRSYGYSAVGSHESRRARWYEGKGECDGLSNHELHAVHVFQCSVSFANLLIVFCLCFGCNVVNYVRELHLRVFLFILLLLCPSDWDLEGIPGC